MRSLFGLYCCFLGEFVHSFLPFENFSDSRKTVETRNESREIRCSNFRLLSAKEVAIYTAPDFGFLCFRFLNV